MSRSKDDGGAGSGLRTKGADPEAVMHPTANVRVEQLTGARVYLPNVGAAALPPVMRPGAMDAARLPSGGFRLPQARAPDPAPAPPAPPPAPAVGPPNPESLTPIPSAQTGNRVATKLTPNRRARRAKLVTEQVPWLKHGSWPYSTD